MKLWCDPLGELGLGEDVDCCVEDGRVCGERAWASESACSGVSAWNVFGDKHRAGVSGGVGFGVDCEMTTVGNVLLAVRC